MVKKVLLYSDQPSRSLLPEVLEDHIAGFGFETSYLGELSDILSGDSFEEYLSFLEFIEVDQIENEINEPGTDPAVKEGTSRRHGLMNMKLYDAYWLQRKLHYFLATETHSANYSECIHIVVTGRLFGTFRDKRYHARVILSGVPSLVSTSGAVEAPARPPEYYWVKARMVQSGMDISKIDSYYEDKYLVHDDRRITDVVCSYAMQLISYFIRGTPFCDSRDCCLYNSHWQKEVLDLQYSKRMCEKCFKALSRII